jgi:hypothetical protein
VLTSEVRVGLSMSLHQRASTGISKGDGQSDEIVSGRQNARQCDCDVLPVPSGFDNSNLGASGWHGPIGRM